MLVDPIQPLIRSPTQKEIGTCERERGGFSVFLFGFFWNREAVLLPLFIEVVLISVC